MSYSITFGDYEINKEFKIYINLDNKQLGVSHNNKIETHNQYGIFGMKPAVITKIMHKNSYFIVKTDKNFVEPIIIFDSWLNKDQTKNTKNFV